MERPLRRFLFRLAIRLGCTVRELLLRIDSAELSEWIAFDRLEPFEDGYWQAALVARTVSGCFTGKPRPLEQFLPKRSDRAQPGQTSEELLAKMRSIYALMAGK